MRLSRRVLLVWFTVVATAIALVGLAAPAATAATGHSVRSSSKSAAVSPATATPGFVPLTPARVLDTRTGTEPTAGSTTTVTIAGHGGVPASGVAAVAVNITAVSPAGPGYLTAYPTGASRPTTSNLNYVKDQIVANQAIVKVGTNGRISLYTVAKTNLLVDVTGYYPTGAAYDALVPRRILDTRSGTEPAAESNTTLVVTGKGGVPTTGVAAVVLNVTAVDPTGAGFITAYPANVYQPDTSTLDYTKGSVVAGMTIVGVGTGGAVNLFTSAKTNMVVDVAGWIPTTKSDFVPIMPLRVLDTRYGAGGPKGPVAAKGTVSVHPSNAYNGIPANATAVEATVTAVSPSGPGFVTAYPAGAARPAASTLNYTTGAIVANSAAVKLGAGGNLTLYTLAKSNLVVDITGYWAPPEALTWGAPTSIDSPRGGPNSISCPTSSFCAAVDDNGNVLTFDGTTWSAPRTVDPNTRLVSVSCPSSNFCAAVGYNDIDFTVSAVTFNGTTWSAPRSIELSAGLPSSVSCSSSTFCVAVDSHGFAETFHGTTWSVPQGIDSYSTDLHSVSCPSSTFCMAVDGEGNALTYNGTGWTAPRNIDSDPGEWGMTSVSCPSTSFCAAVDTYGNALTFRGTTWFAPTSIVPNPSGYDPGLTSVSCPSSTFCTAVDGGGNGNVLTFNGTTWSAARSIDPNNELVSVSCPTSSFCAAVDRQGNALTFNGSWTAPQNIDQPRPLNSVSCASSSFCAAVDATGNALTWDGTTWTAPRQVDPDRALTSVSCPSSTFCATVDHDGNVLNWDGTVWSVPTNIDPNGGGLRSVSCPSSTFCATIDHSGNVLTWNGATWSAPQNIDPNGSMTSVSCPSSTFCVAVGGGHVLTFNGATWTAPEAIDSSGPLDSVSCPATTFCAAVDTKGNALTWDGTAWTTPQNPDPYGGELFSVSCSSSNFCAAVDGDNMLTFAGTVWSAPKNIDQDGNSLVSVSCPTSTFCTAVDYNGNAIVGRA